MNIAEPGSMEFWRNICLGMLFAIKGFSFALGTYFIYKTTKIYINYKKEKRCSKHES